MRKTGKKRVDIEIVRRIEEEERIVIERGRGVRVRVLMGMKKNQGKKKRKRARLRRHAKEELGGECTVDMLSQ